MKEDLLFGRIALLNNIINKEQLEEAISLQKNSEPLRSISFILRQKEQIKRSQVKAILQAQKKNLPRPVKSPEERKEDMAFGYIAFRHEYLTIDDLVKCLKLQGDVAKRGLLFRLSEILYNDKYLTYEQIEEVIQLQQDKILPCSKCQTPYNIVGLPAKARFPCRKCQNIIEVPESLASEDESEKLEKYKIDIEEGILRIQQMPVVQAIIENDPEDEDAEIKENDDSSPEPSALEASETTEKDDDEFSETNETTETDDDEFSEVDETTEADDEFSETDENTEIDDDEFSEIDATTETDDEFSETTETDDEFSETNETTETDNEFSEIDETDDEFSQMEEEFSETTHSMEEEVFAEVESSTPSKTNDTWPREISLDTDEMYAQEMPDLEDVTAKATQKMKKDYNNQLKRKAEFSITTSDLSFFPEDTNTTHLEIGAVQSLTSFSDDEFSVTGDDFFEETVYKKDKSELPDIEMVNLNSDRFSFTSKFKVETKNEDDVISLSSSSKKAKKKVKTTKKDRRTQILKLDLDLSDEDPNALFEDEMISIGPDAIKKHKKRKKKRK
ncbi:hypothetical protein [Candidatus Uabimicrobium sp. HlEnr_7]|uniref:hypothetical protein n=1 Tax=Candidatus Uabimicrobium helgolandensis TaxID=3095367 RepID=UPI0035566052